jgi:hypothetical protein
LKIEPEYVSRKIQQIQAGFKLSAPKDILHTLMILTTMKYISNKEELGKCC